MGICSLDPQDIITQYTEEIKPSFFLSLWRQTRYRFILSTPTNSQSRCY